MKGVHTGLDYKNLPCTKKSSLTTILRLLMTTLVQKNLNIRLL